MLGERPAPSTDIKMIILGDAAVGKTALLYRFEKGVFVEGTQPVSIFPFGYEPLIAVAWGGSCTYWSMVRHNVKDTAGTERFAGSNRFFCRGAKVALLVFDVTDRESFARLAFYWDLVVEATNGECVVILCANKWDIVQCGRKPVSPGCTVSPVVIVCACGHTQAAVTDSDIVQLASSRRAHRTFYTSALSGHNVPEVLDVVCAAVGGPGKGGSAGAGGAGASGSSHAGTGGGGGGAVIKALAGSPAVVTPSKCC